MKHLIFAAAAAAIAFTPFAQAGDNRTTYFWSHPKLGMVRMDKATNAMVTSTPPQAKKTETVLWIDPKGNIRRIPKPAPESQPNR